MRSFALLALAGSATAKGPAPGEVLIFSDSFTTLNTSLWKHEITLSGGGNWEFEWYANNRSTSYVRDGALYISPRLTNDTITTAGLATADVNLWGGDPATTCTDNFEYGCERAGGGGNIVNPVMSAKVRTAETFAFTYGRVEFVAKLPRGDWLWPALWLMPVNAAYGSWPASGEIDIMESRGNAPRAPGGGVDAMSSTLHFGPFFGADGYLAANAQYVDPAGDFSAAFHTYGLSWNATRMQTYVDNTIVLDIDTSTTSFFARSPVGNGTYNPWEGRGPNAPFDQRFYIIMEVAVGGTNGCTCTAPRLRRGARRCDANNANTPTPRDFTPPNQQTFRTARATASRGLTTRSTRRRTSGTASSSGRPRGRRRWSSTA